MGGEGLRCKQRDMEDGITRTEWFSNAELHGVHWTLAEGLWKSVHLCRCLALGAAAGLKLSSIEKLMELHQMRFSFIITAQNSDWQLYLQMFTRWVGVCWVDKKHTVFIPQLPLVLPWAKSWWESWAHGRLGWGEYSECIISRARPSEHLWDKTGGFFFYQLGDMQFLEQFEYLFGDEAFLEKILAVISKVEVTYSINWWFPMKRSSRHTATPAHK